MPFCIGVMFAGVGLMALYHQSPVAGFLVGLAAGAIMWGERDAEDTDHPCRSHAWRSGRKGRGLR